MATIYVDGKAIEVPNEESVRRPPPSREYEPVQADFFNVEEMVDSIVCKTKFMLELYKKYRKSFENKKELGTSPLFRWGEEKELLLQTIDEKDFFQFLEKLKPALERIIQKVAE